MAANPERLNTDGFDVTKYLSSHGLDTVERIKASIVSPVLIAENAGFNTDIPRRIIEAIQAAGNEILAIQAKLKRDTDGAAEFNTADGIVAGVSAGLTFVPVVGLALGPLAGLIGGNASNSAKKRRVEYLLADATKLVNYWQEQISNLQQLAQQYPVKTLTSNPNARTANGGADNSGAGNGNANQTNTLALAGMAGLAILIVAKNKKRKVKA